MLESECAQGSTLPACHTGGMCGSNCLSWSYHWEAYANAQRGLTGNVTFEDMPEDLEIVCPKPLGEATYRAGLHIQKIEGTACALPCPPVSLPKFAEIC